MGDNRFGVGETLTRYQMVTFLCRAFDPDSCRSGLRGSDSFDDVPADHWANYSVGWAVNRGITKGISATEFGGPQTLTREQMITFLYRAEGSPTGGSNGIEVFGDAPDRTHWASLPIGWSFDEGITGGIAAGTFGFGTNVSREEMVLFLCRTAAPDTCQPSQQPLPSSVVDTSTTTDDRDPPPDTTTTTDTEEIHTMEQNSTALTGLFSWAFTGGTGSLRGDHPVYVFYCARQGRYTTNDLTEMVDLLNNESGPQWTRESSGLFTFTFTEGSVISPDLPWNTVDLETADGTCALEAWDVLDPSRDFQNPAYEQLLLLIDTPRRKFDGYGGGRAAISVTREHLNNDMGRFLHVVNHELGHALPGLPHDFVQCLGRSLMIGIGTPNCEAGGAILGDTDWHTRFGNALLLSCHHRRLLGWPVGGDSPPCVLQPPFWPSGSLTSVETDGFSVRWRPPIFTDDVPVDGYTVTVVREDIGSLNVYERHELSADERAFAVDGLPVGRYSIRVWAESEYGSGAAYATPSLVFAPSPDSVTATPIDSTSIRVSWSPVPGATHYVVWNSEDDPPDIFEFDNEGTFTSFSGTVVRGSTSLVLYNRQPDTEYTIKVRACGFEEVFGSEECSFGTEANVSTTPPEPGATAPGAVSLVSITEAGDDWLVLSWDPVPGATFYECGYLTAQNTWLEGPGTGDTSCELWWDSRRVAAGIGLTAGNTYTVGVKACQSALVNCTDWTTATASTQVLAAAPASYPLSVKEVGDTSFTLSWDPAAAGAYYDLRVVTGLSRTFRVAGRTRGVTVPGLQPNTDYTVKVRTCQGAGGNCSSWVTILVSTLRAN